MSTTMLCLASISTLCCISADRYFAVVRPMRYKHVLTPKRALCMLVLVLLGYLSLSFLPLITDCEYHLGTNNCSPVWHRSCGLYVLMTILAFGVPLVTLLSTYGMIFSSIRRHTKRVTHWRISFSGPYGLRERARGHEVAGTDRAYESFVSNSVLDDTKICSRIKEKEMSPDNTSNSMQDVRVFEGEGESTKTRHHDKKFRSHSAGCNHRRPDENLLPFFIQMKASAKTEPVETSQEPCLRSYSVSLSFSISELVPGTVSAMFCSDSNHGNQTEPATSIARSLSLSNTNLKSTEMNELGSAESQSEIPAEKSNRAQSQNNLNYERMGSHSISLTVTTASTPVDGLQSNIPAPSVLNGFMAAPNQNSADLLQRMRETDLSPPPLNIHQLHPPPIALPTPAQFVRDTLPAPLPRKNHRSRSRSLSFETSPEMPRRSTNSLQLPPMSKTSSPLLRLRAITKFKRKLRVNALPREYKIAKIGFILVLVFFLSWGPYMMVHNCQSSSKTPLWVYRTSMWLVYLSCVLNPIVYALSSKHIRLAFSRHLKCCKKLPPQTINTESEVLRRRSAMFRGP